MKFTCLICKEKFNNVCDVCGNEFRFYKKRFEKMPNECFECNPDQFEY